MATAVPAVTPVAGLVTQITIGGTPQVVFPANINGGWITNPASQDDQGLSAPEPLYISPISDATLQGNNTTFALGPGETYEAIPGQTTVTSVNASSSGHKFTAVYW